MGVCCSRHQNAADPPNHHQGNCKSRLRPGLSSDQD